MFLFRRRGGLNGGHRSGILRRAAEETVVAVFVDALYQGSLCIPATTAHIAMIIDPIDRVSILGREGAGCCGGTHGIAAILAIAMNTPRIRFIIIPLFPHEFC